MKGLSNSRLLIEQEKQTTKLFLWIFYIGSFTNLLFLLVYNPFDNHSDLSIQMIIRALVIVLIDFLLLPVAIYYIRKNSPSQIRYIYYLVFTVSNFINDITLYWGHGKDFSTGNALEIVLILFAPMFIDNTYLLFVTSGTIVKYGALGLLFKAPQVLVPIALLILFAVVSFILLHRFKSYAKTIEDIHDKQLRGLVTSFVAMLELKDPYTRGHSERVAHYATILARSHGTSNKEELKFLNYACLLHDIGKVSIPDEILLNPGKLTTEEYETIKKHPAVGAEAILKIEGLHRCIDVVLHHHERWDGQGYPDRLRGTTIPFLARITAIADAFDAMTSSRSYRPAMTPEEAFENIVQGRGTQFDPQLIDLFKQEFPRLVSYLRTDR